jgi:hypothetical protein
MSSHLSDRAPVGPAKANRARRLGGSRHPAGKRAARLYQLRTPLHSLNSRHRHKVEDLPVRAALEPSAHSYAANTPNDITEHVAVEPTEAIPSRRLRSSRYAGKRTGRLYMGNAPPLYSTDIGLIGALGLALLFVINPTSLPFERIALTKHLPMIFGAMSLLMTLCTAGLEPRQTNLKRGAGLASLAVPILLLAAWIIGGSLYARFVDKIHNTFLTVGIYMLAAPGMALYVVCTPVRWRIVGLYMRWLSWAAAFMIVVMLAEHVSTGGYYHELEYLVVPMGVYHALRPGSAPRRTALAAIYLFGGLVFLKLTGFIALGVAVVYLWVVDWRFRFAQSERFRRWATRGIVFISLMGIVATAVIVHHHGRIGPDGNLGYRLVTYSNALHHFLSSPLYGVSFDTSSTKLFTGFEVDVSHGHLPTHSDLLDLAANGGSIAIALLIWGYARILAYAKKTIFSLRVNDDRSAAAHALACMALTGVVVYAFNPILLEPDRALLLWASTGILLGTAICHEQGRTLTTRKTRDEAQEI